MKKYISVILLFLLFAGLLSSQKKLIIFNEDRIMYESSVSDIDSIKFRNSSSYFNYTSGQLGIPVSEIDSITFASETTTPNSEIIYIMYNDNNVTTINPYENNGVNITINGCHVYVISTSGISNLQYRISGNTNNGSLTLTSNNPAILTLSSLTMINPTGAAIYIPQDIATTIQTSGESTLSDGSSSSQNGTITSEGNLTFAGDGTLNIKGIYKHAVSGEKTITVESGTINISQTTTDGLHSEAFVMKGGKLDIIAGSDAIDAGAGTVVIINGEIKITSNTADTKGIKCDGIMTINGGSIDMTVSGAQSKGLSSKKDIFFNNGIVSIITSGKTVLEASGSGYDPSYCTAVKSIGEITVNGGTITIENKSTNDGGKGFSADGNITINGGTVNISTTGNGTPYTNSTGTTDSYTSACIKSDANISILAGNVTCKSTGSGGKGIAADGTIDIGAVNADNSLLTLNVSTSGERFQVSSGNAGGGRPGGGGWGGPGGDSGDYANPKAIKSLGNMTVNSGTIKVSCTQSNEGGEGMESKSTFTINGGDILVNAYDDCINASTHIQINGGTTYCVSSGNDAIDSNGTLTVTGGLTIANGTRSPEEGFDCDNNRFTISGGTIVGTGGATSNPNAGTQKALKYTGTAGNAVCIKNASNEIILLYQMPTYTGSTGGGMGGNSSSMVLLFSDPLLTTGSYTLQYGGTISGGTTVNGYNTGGTYSAGSSKSFSIGSSTLTSVQ